jgi:fructokinase
MVIVCGEALVDLVPGSDGSGAQPRPGGSPANVAVALARLGMPALLLARLSTDVHGQMLRRHLAHSGVNLSLAIDAAEPTSVATVRLDGDGSASYTFELDGRADDAWSPADLPPVLAAGAALHVSGALALVRPALRQTVDALLTRESGQRLVSLDPNPRPALTPDRPMLVETLESWVARCDVVRASAEDLTWTLPDVPVREVARRWRARGPALVVVTRGGDGVFALGPAGECDLPAQPVRVVDTVGAGDAFTAGLLAALGRGGWLTPARLPRLDSESLASALHFAQRVAALTCTRAGADPPWAAELESAAD